MQESPSVEVYPALQEQLSLFLLPFGPDENCGHDWQIDAPIDVEKDPASHSMQDVTELPILLYVPAGQGTHRE